MPCQLPVELGYQPGTVLLMIMSQEKHLHGRLPHGCIFVGMTFLKISGG
jgi:hypothetical protein